MMTMISPCHTAASAAPLRYQPTGHVTAEEALCRLRRRLMPRLIGPCLASRGYRPSLTCRAIDQSADGGGSSAREAAIDFKIFRSIAATA